MDSVWRQNLVFLLLESPVLVYLFVGRMLYAQLLPTLGPTGAYVVYWLGFAFVGVLTVQLFLAVRQSALRAVAGRRFLVGHVYDHTGRGEPIQLELSEYSELGETADEAKVYAVWREENGRRVVDYVLVCPKGKELNEVLAAASVWSVEAGWWYADAQVYPVTLYRPNTEAVDVLRQEVGLGQSVPVYLIRDAPGLVLSGDVNDEGGDEAEGKAREARSALDALRSKQLYTENLALRQELGAIEKSEKNIRAIANKKVGALAAALLESEKRAPKPWTWRPDKWFWITIIVVAVLLFGYWALSKYYALVVR